MAGKVTLAGPASRSAATTASTALFSPSRKKNAPVPATTRANPAASSRCFLVQRRWMVWRGGFCELPAVCRAEFAHGQGEDHRRRQEEVS